MRTQYYQSTILIYQLDHHCGMISFFRLRGVLLFFALQSLLYSSVLCLSSTRTIGKAIHRFGIRSVSTTSLQASLDPTIENFEKSWVEHNIVAKSVKHTSFDWVCGKLRGLQATTSQFKKGSTVVSVPYTETLSASDKGFDGCPEGVISYLHFDHIIHANQSPYFIPSRRFSKFVRKFQIN